MIVTCPSCSSSYKVNESKIKGRGAKITCPRCRQRFVVYRDQNGQSIPPEIATYDFETLGIVWRVRKGMGVTYTFTTLQTLKEFIQDGQVNNWDQITYDNRNWELIKEHDSLDAHFWDIWQKAQRGQITIHPPEEEEEGDDEDESDAPTTIVGRGSELASQISQAVTDAATPAPAGARSNFDTAGHLVLPDEDDEDRNTVTHSDQANLNDLEEAVLDGTPTPAPKVDPERNVPDPTVTPDSPTAAPAPKSQAPPPVAAPPKPRVSNDSEGSGPSFGVIAAVVLMILVLGAVAVWGSGIFGTPHSVEKVPPGPSTIKVTPAPAPDPIPLPSPTVEPAVVVPQPVEPVAVPEPAAAPAPKPEAKPVAPKPAAPVAPSPAPPPGPAPAAPQPKAPAAPAPAPPAPAPPEPEAPAAPAPPEPAAPAPAAPEPSPAPEPAAPAPSPEAPAPAPAEGG